MPKGRSPRSDADEKSAQPQEADVDAQSVAAEAEMDPENGARADAAEESEPQTSPEVRKKGRRDAVNPFDREEFLASNRSNRERYRAEAERKAARKNHDDLGDEEAEALDDAVDADVSEDRPLVDPGRVPGRVEPTSRFGRKRSAARADNVDGGREDSGSRRTWLIGALVAVIAALAISTGLLGYQAATRSDAAPAIGDAERTEVMDTAREYAATLVTYSGDDFDDLDRRIRDIATTEFAEEYITSSQSAREGSGEAEASSTAQADHAGIESMSDDEAVVLVTLDQTLSAPGLQEDAPEGIPYGSRAKVTLVKQADQWRLSAFSVV